MKDLNAELTKEEVEALSITTEEEEKAVAEIGVEGEEYVHLDHRGEEVYDSTIESSENEDIKLEDINKIIEKSKEMKDGLRKELKMTGLSDNQIDKLEKRLLASSEKEILNMSSKAIQDLMGKIITRNIRALQRDTNKPGTPKEKVEAKAMEMLRDLAVYYKQSMEFDKKTTDLESAFTRDINKQEVEYDALNFPNIYSKAILDAKNKMDDPEIEEEKKLVHKFVLYQLMDVINLYTAKAYLKNKSAKGIKSNLRKFNKMNDNIVKELEKSPYTFIDPRATEFAPATYDCIEHLLEDEYKEYSKAIYTILFRPIVRDKFLEENKLYVYFLLKSIRVAYLGDFDQYQEKFTKSLNDLAKLYHLDLQDKKTQK